VKRFRDRDLGVIVTLRGRLPTPSIEFSSNAEYAISTSDLISYLIIGTPGFDFGANATTSQIVASLLSPTVSAFTAGQLRRVFGSAIDLSVELGTYNTGPAGGNIFSTENLNNYLNTATITGGREVYRNLYVGVSAGVCALRSGDLTGVGGKIEYNFKPDVSFQTTFEPSTSTANRANCFQGQQQLNIVPAPSQFTFSLHRTWRF
jgi:hypothetical protein